MKKITAAMYRWGKWKVCELAYNPYSDTNILYRYAREGSISVSQSRDRILCFDPDDAPQYVIDINEAWHHLSRRPKQCVFGKFALTHLINDVGQPITAKMAARVIGVNFDTFSRNVTRGTQTIDGKVVL